MTVVKANPLMSIEELELSTRAHNALMGADITTVGKLIKYNEAELLRFSNFGRKSLKEVQQALAGVGHKLSSHSSYVPPFEERKDVEPIELLKGYVSKAVWKLDVLWRDFDYYRKEHQQMRHQFEEIAQVGGHGPTMRDQFAMAALQGMLMRSVGYEETAEKAYKFADAMMKAREVK